MSACKNLETPIMQHVLGKLSEQELVELEGGHINSCCKCRARLREWEDVAGTVWRHSRTVVTRETRNFRDVGIRRHRQARRLPFRRRGR